MKRILFLAPGESPGGARSKSPPATRGGLRRPLDRGGATLSEVLISLMVMSIGVVSLATLFPISVLRSIQATQLTNATIHRMNAEQLIDTFPRLVHNPQTILPAISEAQSGRFIVDPMGWTNPALQVDFNPAAAYQINSFFGNNSTSNTVPPNPIRRYSGALNSAFPLNTPTAALLAASMGDTWQLAAKGNTTASSTTSVTLPATTDTATFLSAYNKFGTGVRVRVVAMSADGRQSAVREHSTATPLDLTALPTISWTNPIPLATSPRFRLEIYDARYSWLLTVRKTPNSLYPVGDANVDVVVFHKRTYSVASEQIFNLLPKAGANPNNVGLDVGDSQFTLDLTSTNAMTPPVKPFLKKGSFVFDAENAHWYRVVQVREHAVNPVITIDRPAVAAITAGMALPNNGPDILAMPGVVEVYPIGTISYDVNNPPN